MTVPECHLKPRKQLRPRFRADLTVEPQQFEGETCYVVKDPVRLAYWRFKEPEHFVIEHLDGRHTLDQIRTAFERRFRPARLSEDELETFAHQLMTSGLVHDDTPRAGEQLHNRRNQQRRRERLSNLVNFLCLRLPLADPDRLFDRMLPYLRWIFTRWFMAGSVALILAALLLVLTRIDAFLARLPAAGEFFRLETALSIWFLLGGVKVIHEIGHGLTCKAFGGEVHEIGLMFLVFSPCMYCDVTDSWTLPDKYKRMAIAFAGIWVELVIASLATLVWWHTPAQPFLHHLCLYLMVVCSVSTVMFNGNPLLRFDGYYILADWLEIPNLRDRCNQFFQRLVLRHALGIGVRAEAGMSRGRRILFVGYAVASYLYLWLVAFGILWFLYTFLKPYNLGSIGALLACLAGLSMVGWPVVRLVTGLKKAGRVPEMNPRRVLTSGGMAAVLVLAVCLVPLPISSICRTALVQVHPEASEKVYVPLPGILDRWHVRNGQAVGRGQVLAEFRHLDLENQLEEARTEYDVRTVHLAGLREQLGSTIDVADRQRIAGQLTAVENERAALLRQIAVFEKNLHRLEVRAPLSGIVLGGPQIDEVGKRWDDPDRPLCSIAEPGRLQALVPLDPADYRLVREDIDRLTVSVRSPGHGRRRWTGRVASLPESEAREIPLALSNRGGGPVAVQIGRHSLVPQSQQYLVAVDIVDPVPSIYPGTLVQVKFSCRWQTLRWWLWRSLSASFDVGLW